MLAKKKKNQPIITIKIYIFGQIHCRNAHIRPVWNSCSRYNQGFLSSFTTKI